MTKIKVQDITASFEEIQGWKYVSPGSNNINGIDCSGAFCRAFQQQGKSIYHGSNRIIRKHCHDVQKITNVSVQKPGMAVFKARTDLTKLSAQYKAGGAYYNADLLYDFYHIGLVVSINPLKIIHATPPKAKQDTALGTWTWCGMLNDVDYNGITTMPVEATESGLEAFVFADNGLPVKLRQKPNKTATWLSSVPVGTKIEVIENGAEWSKVKAGNKTGYMMTEFIKRS